ncbi:MAG TPA: hypothetical protein VI636_09125 [Candidatus Angelobacter sp.]
MASVQKLGPPVYENWQAMLIGEPLQHAAEFPLYSDALIVGEGTYGPYVFLHTVPLRTSGVVRPTLILRSEWYWAFPYPSFEKTDAERYHAGTPPEEIAALASLAMGVRMRAGESVRDFFPGGDPKGTPRAWATRPEPVLMVNPILHSWILPRAVENEHSIELLQPLTMLPKMSPQDAISLVRAARSYQDALWLVESEPELAWLLMVAALETAANHWRREKETPTARLESANAQLYSYLLGLGNAEILARVADEIADSLGATRKFLDFVLNFLPPEPEERPQLGKIDWTPEALKKILKVIYGYRSKALHEGRPFPAPMCEAPHRADKSSAPAEKPISLGSSQGGGVWLAKDTPLLLHTFEYITRGSLINWWRSMAAKDISPHSGPQ